MLRSSSNNTPLLSPSSTSGSSSTECKPSPGFNRTNNSLFKRSNTENTSTGNNNNDDNTNRGTSLVSVTTPITPLHAIPYVHGSYASASPAFVQSSSFCHILKRLLPSAYDELKSLMKGCRSSSNRDNNNNTQTASGNNRNTAATTTIKPDPVKLMKWAENNPVVSAYGMYTSDSGRRTISYTRHMNHYYNNNKNDDNNNDGDDFHSLNNEDYRDNDEFAVNPKSAFRRRQQKHLNNNNYNNTSNTTNTTTTFEIRSHNKPALEWDVFLDPKLIRQVSAAMEVVDAIESRIHANQRQKQRARTKSGHYRNATTTAAAAAAATSSSQLDEQEEDDDDDFDFELYQSHTAAQVEVDRLVSQLMKRMILAHGSMSQLVLEAFGVARDYNYNSVVKGVRRSNNTQKNDSVNKDRRGKDSYYVWDKRQEQLDFETLLHPEYTHNGTAAAAATTSPRNNNTANEKKANFVGSRGIFMENWLSIFSQTLVLLKNNNNNNNRSGTTTGDYKSNHATKKKSSRGSKKHEHNLRIETTESAQIGQVEGIGGLLSRLFMRKDSSFAIHSPKPTKHNQNDNNTSDENDDISNDYVDYDTSMDASSDIMAMPSLLDLSPRSNDSDAYDDMFSSSKAPSSSFLCGMTLCLTGDDSMVSSTKNDMHYASHNMSRDIQRISEVLGEPLRLVLDLKSRRVPPKVWSRLIDTMRSRGLVVDGIGSFDMDELRIIAKSCSCPLTPILFFHSVGDLQRACHANEVKKGDTVYFNGGSLMWKPSKIMEAAERGCCGCIETTDVETADDDMDVLSDVSLNKPYKSTNRLNSSGEYSFQPYAYPRNSLSDWERVMCKSTLECYQKHFNLKVGVYVQEFSISPEALDALAKFVNAHGSLYDQGMAFGGINGVAINHIRGDGYWNQRYVGRSWDFKARPANHMMPLKPEDHHMVQKAIQAGAWAQVAQTFEVTDEMAGAMTLPNGGTLALKQREPCNPFQPSSTF